MFCQPAIHPDTQDKILPLSPLFQHGALIRCTGDLLALLVTEISNMSVSEHCQSSTFLVISVLSCPSGQGLADRNTVSRGHRTPILQSELFLRVMSHRSLTNPPHMHKFTLGFFFSEILSFYSLMCLKSQYSRFSSI